MYIICCMSSSPPGVSYFVLLYLGQMIHLVLALSVWTFTDTKKAQVTF